MPHPHSRVAIIGAITLLLLIGCATTARDSVRVVAPTVETEPMPHAGDAADDPAIWVNPADPALSTIIGTDKLGGLAFLQGVFVAQDGKNDGGNQNFKLVPWQAIAT